MIQMNFKRKNKGYQEKFKKIDKFNHFAIRRKYTCNKWVRVVDYNVIVRNLPFLNSLRKGVFDMKVNIVVIGIV